MAEAVPMLVPNPNEDGVEPQIGTEKASDLSDLSDHDQVNDDDDEDDFVLSSSDEEEKEVEEPKQATKSPPENVSTKIELIKTNESPPPPAKAKVEAKANVVSTNGSSKNEKPVVVARSSSVPKKPARKAEKGITFISIPQDYQSPAGKTAKFTCAISESSPSYSKYFAEFIIH